MAAAALPPSISIDIDPFIDNNDWIDFSSLGLTLDDEAETQPAAKRAKLGENSAVRKQVSLVTISSDNVELLSALICYFCRPFPEAKPRGSSQISSEKEAPRVGAPAEAQFVQQG